MQKVATFRLAVPSTNKLCGWTKNISPPIFSDVRLCLGIVQGRCGTPTIKAKQMARVHHIVMWAEAKGNQNETLLASIKSTKIQEVSQRVTKKPSFRSGGKHILLYIILHNSIGIPVHENPAHKISHM